MKRAWNGLNGWSQFGSRLFAGALVASLSFLTASAEDGGMTIPLRTATGYNYLPVNATAAKSAAKADHLQIEIAGVPAKDLPVATNRAIIPLSVEQGDLVEQYGLTVLNGVLHGTMVEVTGPSVVVVVEAVQQMESDGIIPWFEMNFDNLDRVAFTPNDSRFSEQVHLNGTSEADVNTIGAWDITRGAGVVIGIIDNGGEYTHEDLTGNSRTDLHYDYFDNDADPMPESPDEAHGTAVAGCTLAVGNNNLGVAAPAYQADYVSLRAAGPGSFPAGAIINSLVHNSTASNASNQMWVLNNSYGRTPGLFSPFTTSPAREAAYREAAENGRGGRGTVLLYASGNDRLPRDWGDSSRYIGIVGSISMLGSFADYTNYGFNLLVCAPGGDASAGAGIVTTDRSGNAGYANGNYAAASNNVQGTSFASPVASGVAGLILAARPTLTWRDVMEILARSAQQNDRSQGEWFTNAAGLPYNPNYGFGNVDAEQAVLMAQSWRPLPEELNPVVDQVDVEREIPDGVTTGIDTTMQLVTDPRVDYVIEYAELRIRADHDDISDLRIRVTSPSGTQISVPRPVYSSADMDHILGFQCFRGEKAAGNWTVSVADLISENTGILERLELTVYGYDASRLPFISSLSNPALAVQDSSFDMYIYGSNFEEISVAILQHPIIGEREEATTFVTENQLGLTVPASFLSEPGSFTVRIKNTDEDISAPAQIEVVNAPLVEDVGIDIHGFMTSPVNEAWWSVNGGTPTVLPLGPSNDFNIEDDVPDAGASLEIEIMGRTTSGVVIRRTIDVSRGADS